MGRPRSKLTESQEKALLADIQAAPTTPGATWAAKYGISEARVSRVRSKLRRGASPEVVQVVKNAIITTKSRPAAFSLRLADTADALLDDIERARADAAASEDPKFRIGQTSVIARALRDIAEAKETLMKQGLPGMTKEELRKALEERAKEKE